MSKCRQERKQHAEKGKHMGRGFDREIEDNRSAPSGKFHWYRLLQYMPWFMLLLVVDCFACIFIWISDINALRAISASFFLTTVFFFAAVCGALFFLEKGKEKAFWAFLENPDEYHEEVLRRAAGIGLEESVHLLGNLLREKDNCCGELQSKLAEYEEYVESWAHETKMPLSLLALLLDNRREELPDSIGFKLEYIENRMGEYIDQMLFYARVKGIRKDYLFESVEAGACIGEVLEDYGPLLEEKQFTVGIPDTRFLVYTDRRGFRFLLQQLVSNAVKYSGDEPRLEFCFQEGEQSRTLSVRDNGRGVRSCDLPYIFEKGFTGHSGEGRKEATGMGLYLAWEIAEDLGLQLEAGSQWGKGFEMRIVFPVVVER